MRCGEGMTTLTLQTFEVSPVSVLRYMLLCKIFFFVFLVFSPGCHIVGKTQLTAAGTRGPFSAQSENDAAFAGGTACAQSCSQVPCLGLRIQLLRQHLRPESSHVLHPSESSPTSNEVNFDFVSITHRGSTYHITDGTQCLTHRSGSRASVNGGRHIIGAFRTRKLNDGLFVDIAALTMDVCRNGEANTIIPVYNTRPGRPPRATVPRLPQHGGHIRLHGRFLVHIAPLLQTRMQGSV